MMLHSQELLRVLELSKKVSSQQELNKTRATALLESMRAQLARQDATVVVTKSKVRG